MEVEGCDVCPPHCTHRGLLLPADDGREGEVTMGKGRGFVEEGRSSTKGWWKEEGERVGNN